MKRTELLHNWIASKCVPHLPNLSINVITLAIAADAAGGGGGGAAAATTTTNTPPPPGIIYY